MGSCGSRRAFFWLPLVVGGLAAGCGSKGASTTSSSLTFDADFSVCEPSPQAVRYAPGISVVSMSGAYQATITSASTEQTGAPVIATAAIGYDTFTVTVTTVANGGTVTDGGAAAATVTDGGTATDGGAAAPDGLTMEPPPIGPAYPADPYMPLHGHGASTVPTVTAQGGGVFSVADIDFFMGGYWQLYLELTPPGGAADPLTFNICIPDD